MGAVRRTTRRSVSASSLPVRSAGWLSPITRTRAAVSATSRGFRATSCAIRGTLPRRHVLTDPFQRQTPSTWWTSSLLDDRSVTGKQALAMSEPLQGVAEDGAAAYVPWHDNAERFGLSGRPGSMFLA